MVELLQIQLLGGFHLSYDGEELNTRIQARQQTLLAYLMLHEQRPQLRQHVSFLFWPDLPEKRALANLRHAIYHLRRLFTIMDDHLEVTPTHLCWRSSEVCCIDVTQFEDLLIALDHEPELERQQALLTQAAALYGGELLPGCYDDWILPYRERLSQAHLQVLQRLTDLLVQSGDYSTAIETATKLKAADPYRESSYQRLMELHEVAGNQAAALRVYHDCATLLEQELNVAPGPPLRAVYERILQRDGSVTTSPPTPNSTLTNAENYLVGRDEEVTQLQSDWQAAAQSGRAYLTLIQGEAGIGKTRLAEAFVRWAQHRGITTVQVRAYAAEGALAYASVTDWLRSQPYRRVLISLDAVWLVEIARLLPEVLASRSDLSLPGPLTERWQRRRFFEALASAVHALGVPLVVQFDDLQWADQETLEWLAYLLRIPPPKPLMLVGTVRIEEIDTDHPLMALLTQLRRNDQLRETSLTALNAADCARLAEQMGDGALDAQIVDRLWAYTGGIPLFIKETIRAELGKGENERWQWMETANQWKPSPAIPVPPKVYDLLHERLLQLSADGRRLAQTAAVIGRAFSTELLRQAVEMDSTAVLRGLDELWQQRLVQESGHMYDFGHDCIRDVAYDDISPVRRKALHLQVAEALLQIHSTDLDAVSAQLAHHYERAGEIDTAVGYYLQAGEAAHRVYAENRASELLSRGLALIETLPETTERNRRILELCAALSATIRVSKGWAAPELYKIVNRAWPLVERIGDFQQRFRLLLGMHTYHLIRGNIEETHTPAQQLLTLAGKNPHSSYELCACTVVGGSHFHMGHLQIAQQFFSACEGLYSPELHETCILSFGVDYGVLKPAWQSQSVWCMGYPDRALALCRDALAIAEKLQHPFSQTLSLAYLAMVHQFRSDVAEVYSAANAGLIHAEQNNIGYYRTWAEILCAWKVARQQPDPDQIIRLRNALEEFRNDGCALRYPYYLSLLADAYTEAGDEDAGLEAIREAQNAAQRQGEHWWDAELYRQQGDLYRRQGKVHANAEAEIVYHQALSIAREQKARSLELRAAISLARLWQCQGRQEEARQLLSPIYAWFSEGFATPDLQDARTLLAELH